MSEPGNVRNLLAEAERAARTGDLSSAEALLREVALLQETQLGPLHPDLANTLNNLAVITEKAARLDEAETFYRRAVAIASASLPPDDPMVAASRQNLEEFCYEHGLPRDKPAIVEPVAAVTHASPAIVTVSPPTSPVSRKASRAPAMLAIGVAGLVIAALSIARPWSPRRTSTALPAAVPTPAPATAPAAPAPAAAAPVERPPAAKVEEASVPGAPPPPGPAPAPNAVALVTVQLCRTFSTSSWRCDPAGESVAPGPIVFYTRVRSPRDGVIVHRWYRGDTLRQSVQLRIGANAAEGYRTYSRQTVDHGDWRVEVRSAAGDLLHEQRLAVR